MFERLTFTAAQREADHLGDAQYFSPEMCAKIDKRLFEYENTGLTPDEIAALRAEAERYKQWVDDLQSGMYVNCVYCGHRYGPGETTPVSMADALKAHVEQCPKHPMSALKAEIAAIRAEVERLRDENGLLKRTIAYMKEQYENPTTKSCTTFHAALGREDDEDGSATP